jgi:hypothetical protein
MLVAVGLLGMAGAIVAQQVPGGVMAEDGALPSNGMALQLPPSTPEPRTYGTSSLTVHTIQAYEFVSINNAQTYTGSGLSGGFACGGSPCAFVAPVSLPAGALVTFIELEGCDTDAVADLSLSLFRITLPAGLATIAVTQTVGAPGCTRVIQALATPETIDNLNRSYALQVTSGATNTTRFFAVRIFYILQVSPAPAVATFADVPTSHPFFRFVETLARSGITSGCGGGNFCPDAPLTRGQMAVFLSLGLGLHFAP